MAARLHPEIQIIAAPTIRDTSGLALSSRNVRLSSQGLEGAEVISKVLRAASSESSLTGARQALKQIEKHASFTLDYAEIIDEESFQVADESSLKTRVIIAGWIEGVRLIDNMAMQNSLVRA
jgi:pantoate--beta-alanine ligase